MLLPARRAQVHSQEEEYPNFDPNSRGSSINIKPWLFGLHELSGGRRTVADLIVSGAGGRRGLRRIF